MHYKVDDEAFDDIEEEGGEDDEIGLDGPLDESPDEEEPGHENAGSCLPGGGVTAFCHASEAGPPSVGRAGENDGGEDGFNDVGGEVRAFVRSPFSSMSGKEFPDEGQGSGIISREGSVGAGGMSEGSCLMPREGRTSRNSAAGSAISRTSSAGGSNLLSAGGLHKVMVNVDN